PRAIADLSQAIQLNEKHAAAWSLRGTAYARLGRLDRARDDLSQAIKLNARDAVAWLNRGIVYTQLGQPEKGSPDLSEFIKLAPKHPALLDAYLLRGQAHDRLKHFLQAREDWEQARKLAPGRADVHNGLAWLLATCPEARVRDPKQAARLAQKAVEL